MSRLDPVTGGILDTVHNRRARPSSARTGAARRAPKAPDDDGVEIAVTRTAARASAQRQSELERFEGFGEVHAALAELGEALVGKGQPRGRASQLPRSVLGAFAELAPALTDEL